MARSKEDLFKNQSILNQVLTALSQKPLKSEEKNKKFLADILQLGVIRDDLPAVEKALEMGADVQSPHGFLKSTPLHLAAMTGHQKIIALLLSKGASLEALDQDRHTPLQIALLHKKIAASEILMKQGARVTLQDAFECTPLDWALCWPEQTQLINSIIRHGASPEDRIELQKKINKVPSFFERMTMLICTESLEDSLKNQTVLNQILHFAARQGNLSALKKAIECGADVNSKIGALESTALHHAVLCDDSNLASALLKSGAFVNALDRNQQTPLQLALQKSYLSYSLCDSLAERGACLTQPDHFGCFPLHWVVLRYKDRNHLDPLLKSLMIKGASIETKAEEGILKGLTPLKLISNKTKQKKIKQLHQEILQNQSCFNQLLDSKQKQFLAGNIREHLLLNQILHHAAQQGQPLLVQKCLELGADPHSTEGTLKSTPLHHAATRGSLQITHLLLAVGAPLEAHDEEGHTPLQVALLHRHIATAQLLLQKGASLNVHDAYGCSPLDWAIFFGTTALLQSFLQRGTSSKQAEYLSEQLKNLPKLDKMLLILSRQNLKEAFKKKTLLNQALYLGTTQESQSVVKAALEKGADIHSTHGLLESTALHQVAQNGDATILRLLLEKNPLVDALDKEGQTALQRSIFWNKKNAAGALIKAGANITSGDPQKRTPLHWAVLFDQGTIIHDLIEKGASLKTKSKTGILSFKKGSTPLMLAKSDLQQIHMQKLHREWHCRQQELKKIRQEEHKKILAFHHVWQKGEKTEIMEIPLDIDTEESENEVNEPSEGPLLIQGNKTRSLIFRRRGHGL